MDVDVDMDVDVGMEDVDMDMEDVEENWGGERETDRGRQKEGDRQRERLGGKWRGGDVTMHVDVIGSERLLFSGPRPFWPPYFFFMLALGSAAVTRRVEAV